MILHAHGEDRGVRRPPSATEASCRDPGRRPAGIDLGNDTARRGRCRWGDASSAGSLPPWHRVGELGTDPTSRVEHAAPAWMDRSWTVGFG